jgi:hypothetical protein
MEWNLAASWSGLCDQEVQLRIHGCVVRTGIVEDLTEDGHVLWLRASGVDHRMLFTKAEGYSAWTAGVADI